MTTGRTITDPAELGDFTDVDGQEITLVGEDGDVILMLGHPDAAVALAALETFVVEQLGWDHLTDAVGADIEPDDEGALERRWARFFTTDTCPDDDECGLTSNHWHVNWSATEPADGLIPVTVLDCS